MSRLRFYRCAKLVCLAAQVAVLSMLRTIFLSQIRIELLEELTS